MDEEFDVILLGTGLTGRLPSPLMRWYRFWLAGASQGEAACLANLRTAIAALRMHECNTQHPLELCYRPLAGPAVTAAMGPLEYR